MTPDRAIAEAFVTLPGMPPDVMRACKVLAAVDPSLSVSALVGQVHEYAMAYAKADAASRAPAVGAGDAEDAARYRFLRVWADAISAPARDLEWRCNVRVPYGTADDSLDAAIDAAIDRLRGAK